MPKRLLNPTHSRFKCPRHILSNFEIIYSVATIPMIFPPISHIRNQTYDLTQIRIVLEYYCSRTRILLSSNPLSFINPTQAANYETTIGSQIMKHRSTSLLAVPPVVAAVFDRSHRRNMHLYILMEYIAKSSHHFDMCSARTLSVRNSAGLPTHGNPPEVS